VTEDDARIRCAALAAEDATHRYFPRRDPKTGQWGVARVSAGTGKPFVPTTLAAPVTPHEDVRPPAERQIPPYGPAMG
jgi:hypothetical protein